MSGIDNLDFLFIVTAFALQVILIIHFAVRKWSFATAVRYGYWVYASGIPAALVSIVLAYGGKSWSLVLGGFLFLVWGIFGYVIEYVKKIEWRNPIYWPVFGPYVLLYLAALMFYWFPLALISRPLVYVYAVLYIISTVMNVTSHKK
jgi:hypothetical protein